jgi:DNA-binding transcriptional LysR family regulator
VNVAVAVGVGVGPSGAAQYLPPLLKALTSLYPPQTIISLPVQTAVCQ